MIVPYAVKQRRELGKLEGQGFYEGKGLYFSGGVNWQRPDGVGVNSNHSCVYSGIRSIRYCKKTKSVVYINRLQCNRIAGALGTSPAEMQRRNVASGPLNLIRVMPA